MLTMICNVMCVDMKHVCLLGSGRGHLGKKQKNKNPDLYQEKMKIQLWK